MTLQQLYNRVVESLGFELPGIESLSVAIANCYADLTSRGYQLFKEKIYEGDSLEDIEANMFTTPKPRTLRKTLYCRVQFKNGMAIAHRLVISNPIIQSRVTDNGFRTPLNPRDVVFYIKENNLVIEWGSYYEGLERVYYGYYASLETPPPATNEEELEQISLDIRPEFEDAVVLFAIYFYHARAIKDDVKTDFHLRNYKYYVEDLVHQLSHEDGYYENDVISEE